jgi:hypothetical protein
MGEGEEVTGPRATLYSLAAVVIFLARYSFPSLAFQIILATPLSENITARKRDF